MGERLGRYELVKRLGQGGMAEVFLARQDGVAGFSKELVIKRVLPDLVADQQFVEMFLDEARLAARLSHPNICQTFELGEVSGQYFIAMELIPGRTLAELIRSAREKQLTVPLAAALRIIGQLCEALHYAHRLVDENGKPLELVHRDVTPSNVMVTPDGSVKLLDFGIARAATRIARTQVGMTKGKLGFMAPEQINTPQALDSRVDLFAMGALLYLLTVGKAPYADTPKPSLLQEMGLGRFPPPRQVNPLVPEEIEAIILQAMAVSREARFATAHKVHRALEKAALKLGLSVGPHALRDFLARVDGVATTGSFSELIPVPPPAARATEPMGLPSGPYPSEPIPVPPLALAATRSTEPVGLPPSTYPSDLVQVGRTPEVEGATRISKPPQPPDYTRAEIEFEEQATQLIRKRVPAPPAAPPITVSEPKHVPRSRALLLIVPALLLTVVGMVAFVVTMTRDDVAKPPEVVAKAPEDAAKPPDVKKPPDARRPPDVKKPPDVVAKAPDVKKPPEVKKPLVPKPPAVAAAPLDMSGPLGTLKVITAPAAKVSVAGNPLGETPLTRKFPVGSHRLRIEYKSGASHQLLINVVEGRETLVRDVED